MVHSAFKQLSVALAASVLCISARADFVLLPDGVEVLDTSTQLVWLRDWSSLWNGVPNDWAHQAGWANLMTTGDVAAGVWRLPDISEYVQLWHEVGDSLVGLSGNGPTGPTYFLNVQEGRFWASNELAGNPYLAWYGDNSGAGAAGADFKGTLYFATAVRPLVFSSPVPEPASWELLAMALAAGAAFRCLRTHRPHTGRGRTGCPGADQ